MTEDQEREFARVRGLPWIPAFPVPSYVNVAGETHDVEFQGMSLRDYFAAKALQGLLASGWCSEARELTPGAGERELANDAYAMANAMLKARND